MDAGFYAKDMIDVVEQNSKLFYNKANKSATVFEQILQVDRWKDIENKLHNVSSLFHIIYPIDSMNIKKD